MLPVVTLNSVQSLFRPDRVAQVIVNSNDRGTPIMDRFYPESARRYWPSVLVPISEITRVTRAMPLVRRGAPGLTIPGTSMKTDWYEPQPVKTVETLGATEYNNAALVSPDTVQEVANSKTAIHVDAHRKTADALCGQSLTGALSFPIANMTGSIIDSEDVTFGTPTTLLVSANWLLDATPLETVLMDLIRFRTEMQRRGYQMNTLLAGENVLKALFKKIHASNNDNRTPAYVDMQGRINIAGFVIELWAAEYYHPGNADGSITEGYKSVVGADELFMYDSGAQWTFLRVRIDNFRYINQDPGPLSVIAKMSEDESVYNLYFESKPFPIPPVRAIQRANVTTTA